MATTTKPNQIPARTPLADNNGLATNAWYHWWKDRADQLQTLVNGAPYVSAGGGGTTSPVFGFGTAANIPEPGATGDVYFTTDTKGVFLNFNGNWQLEIPAFNGDLTSVAGSQTLTLNSVNPVTHGNFTNATITVNSKGLVTFAASGSPAASSDGASGTIQLADGLGGFVGDQTDFSYVNIGTPTLNIGDSTLVPGSVINLISNVAAANAGIPVRSLIAASSNLTLSGIEGLTLQTAGTNWIGLATTGDLLLQGSAGNANDVLTSQGPGFPPLWEAVGSVTLTFGFCGNMNCGHLTGPVIAQIDCGTLSGIANFWMNLGTL